MEIIHYSTAAGRVPYEEWFDSLRDAITKNHILRRLDRLTVDNFGDAKYCREGVWELRIDRGPGYRIYCARVGRITVILLAAGDKSSQSGDIDRAVDYLKDFKAANGMSQVRGGGV